MKKVILVLFSLMLSVALYSQGAEGYGTTIFKLISTIENDDWAMSDNRCFQVNDTTYILAYEPLRIPKAGNYYNKDITDKNIYLYRRDTDGWKKASGLIRHDYFYGHFVKGSSFTADSLKALDAHVRRDDIHSYGKIKIDPKKSIVTIEIKTLVWRTGYPAVREEFDDLILMPKGNGTYNFIIKPTVKAKK